ARLFHSMHSEFSKTLARHRINAPCWGVLISLYQERARTPSGISRYLGIDASTVTRVLDRLEAERLVSRKPGRDRRSLALELSPRARSLVPKLARVALSLQTKFLSPLSAAEARRLKSTLRRILEARGGTRIQPIHGYKI
ncbi:MAG: MarR family transcriptional regulator, partial [Planctomycetes bacterium]|nr:MarR family transcriptional regulator [Planctomycetota bacterium]